MKQGGLIWDWVITVSASRGTGPITADAGRTLCTVGDALISTPRRYPHSNRSRRSARDQLIRLIRHQFADITRASGSGRTSGRLGRTGRGGRFDAQKCLDTGAHRREPIRRQPIEHVIALAMGPNHPRLRHQAQVLGQCGLGDPNERRQFLRATRPLGDERAGESPCITRTQRCWTGWCFGSTSTCKLSTASSRGE